MSASVDELRATVGTLSLSQIAPIAVSTLKYFIAHQLSQKLLCSDSRWWSYDHNQDDVRVF